MKEPEIFELPNGIRIAHKEAPQTRVMHCGLVLDIGSRDETELQKGLAHFWEHMAFKGTTKRKAFHIINRLDSVGGELNAFTTKEKITFYASVLDRYFENAIELLKDITFNSVFPPLQIEREKGVILEEMAMYRDTPEESIHDEFDEILYGNHPLGYNILGTTESVRGFHQGDFKEFLNMHLDTSRIVFSSVGNLSSKRVLQLVERHLGDIPSIRTERKRLPFMGAFAERRTIEKPISQSHYALGCASYALSDSKRPVLAMLSNLLGGPAMNSRLNLELRERKGLVYSIESSYVPFEDTGMFGIYFATDPRSAEKGLTSVWKELRTLKEKRLGTNQLKSAKEQLMGQIAISEEKNSGFMLMMGKSLLELGRIETLQEIFDRIESITQTELLEVANETFIEDRFAILKYIPQD